MKESYVGNGSGSCKYADSNVFATREAGDSFDDVVSSRNFENVRTHGRVGFASDDDRWFELVFGAWRTTSGSTNDFNGSSIASASNTAAATTGENRVMVGGRVFGGRGGVIGIIGVRGLGFARELEVMREREIGVLVLMRVVEF